MHWTKTGWMTLACASIMACGGSPEPDTDTVAGATDGTGAGQTGGAETEGPTEGEPAQPAEPAPQQAQGTPIAAENADAIREALRVAAGEGEALVRMIDPDRGIGAWDRGENSKVHFCDTARLGREPALGFEVREGDEWTCNDEMTRCFSVDPADRTGTVFHFTEADGGAGRWLDSIITYDRRVPRFDTEDVTAWVRAADGVCDLYRTLREGADGLSPEKITVYVSRFRGDEVGQSSTDFKCGDEAKAALTERIGPLAQAGPPTSCNREPHTCSWMEADEIRVYGVEGEPYAVAVLGANLPENRARQQERDVATVIDRARTRRCP